jgi:hypothetical protein
VAHVARRDHGLDFASKDFLESSDQVDLEFVCIFEDLRVEQDLVGFAEAEIKLVLVEQFFVRLEKLSAAQWRRMQRVHIPWPA